MGRYALTGLMVAEVLCLSATVASAATQPHEAWLVRDIVPNLQQQISFYDLLLQPALENPPETVKMAAPTLIGYALQVYAILISSTLIFSSLPLTTRSL